MLWATYLAFGELAFEALHKLHPSAAQLNPEFWRFITDLCPVTTDRQKLVKVAEFLGASVSAIHPVWTHREIFRWGAALAAKVPRDWLAVRIEAAREGRDGLSLTELGEGWFRIKDEAVPLLLWEKCGHPFGSYEQALAERAKRQPGLKARAERGVD
jgi:hypothetical protein